MPNNRLIIVITVIIIIKIIITVIVIMIIQVRIMVDKLERSTNYGPSIYDMTSTRRGEEGVRLRWTGEGRGSPMWTSTQKIKI